MFDPKRYPKNWHEIAASIRARAGNRCEQCGVSNGANIIRGRSDPSRYIIYDDDKAAYFTVQGDPIRLSEIPSEYDYEGAKNVKIILTIHHIGVTKPDGTPGDPRDKMDCRPENLIALCQRCHLLADMPMAVRARRRAAKKHQNQLSLLEVEE